MELKKYQIAEMSARNALKIVEAGSHSYAQSAQQYDLKENVQGSKRILEGGVKNTLKNKIKSNVMGYQQSEQDKRFEEEREMKQRMANAKVPGVSSSAQLIEMKCSILFIIGQSLIEQDRLGEAQMVFENALVYASQLK